MNGRPLGIELRRSTAPVLGVLLIVFGVGLAFLLSGPWWKGGGAWDQQWTGLALWQRNLLQFLVPVALGCGAWQGMRDSRARTDELFSSTPRPRGQRSLVNTGAMSSWALVGYLLFLVAAGFQVAGSTGYFHDEWIPIAAVGALSLIALTLLGMGIGRLLPSLLTPPVLALVGLFGVAILGAVSDFSPIVLLSPVTDGRTRDAFTTLAAHVSAVQLMWFAALIVTGYLMVVAMRRWARLAAILPAALAAAVAIPLLPGERADAYVVDQDATELVCAEGVPQVCLTRAHSGHLEDFAGPARDALTKLAKLPGAPKEVREIVPGEPVPPGVAPAAFDSQFGLTLWNGELRDPDTVRYNLLAGAGTLPCDSAGWGKSYLRGRAARAVAAGWLNGGLRPLVAHDEGEPRLLALMRNGWQRLRALPVEAQRERIVAIREAARSCDGDLFRILEETR